MALVASKFDSQSGFTSLLRFGETWNDRRLVSLQSLPLAIVLHSNGYDGQFYVQLAMDPLLQNTETAQVLDAPAYRARRILLPGIAAIAGFGRPWWILQVYALLNVACWFALAALLRRMLPADGWMSFARWAGCMFGMGILESVRQSLVDLPALLLLTLALVAHERARAARSTGWLAVASLAKESSLLGALALSVDDFRWPFITKRKAISLLIAAVPLVGWAYYVSTRFPSSPVSSGAGNFTWPLVGIVWHVKTCATEIMAGNWDGRFTMGLLAAIGFAVQAWSLWRRPDIRSGWWRVGAAYAFLLLLLSPWVWAGYWAASRALLPATIAFNLLLPGNSRSFWPLWILGNFTLLHALWRFL
ncbi:MAG: hypothetical protein WDM96_19130 [Lacunisphaera sp.]